MTAARVVIVGGGAIGCASACFILSDPAFRGTVTVIERDPAYRRASSALSASSIRQQFSTPVNIRLSQFGIEFLRTAGARLATDGTTPDIALREPGYLFLASPEGLAALRANHALQAAHDADVALLEPDALSARFPWLSVAGIAGGVLGLSGEGWFDGYALLAALRAKAVALGARFIPDEATGFVLSGTLIAAVTLAGGDRADADVCVNAAGPWAARVAAWAGVDLPVRARRRTVFVVSCPRPPAGCPLVIDPSGTWFRPEGPQFICGVSPDPAQDPDDLPLDPDHAQFADLVWPALAQRVPAFEALRQTSAWAGYYEYNTFDQNGIVGEAPGVANLILANGFSGHGIQHSPGMGRAVAELVVHGRYRTLDLAPLGYARIPRGEPLREQNVV